MNRVFYIANPAHDPSQDTVHGSDKFIALREGETGYYKTTVYTQDHADCLNQRQGITPAQLEAAQMCSMFGNWDRFDRIAARFSDGPKAEGLQLRG